MTVKEYFEKNPNTAATIVWAADTKGGFGKKGWSVYGRNDDLTVVKVVPKNKSWANVELHVWNNAWGEL